MILGENNDLFHIGSSAEDQMKVNAVRLVTEERYEVNMYKDAAKRVVFHNCMSTCEIDPKAIPHFNRNFYYNQLREQSCL